MKIVYPPSGHQTFESSTFLIGAVQAGETVCIQGQPVPTSLSGSFAWPVPLQPGENEIQIVALDSQQQTTAEQRITVLQPEPIAPMPVSPLALHPAIYGPKEPQVLKSGDWLTVSCLASPGAQVSFTVPGLFESPVPMVEAGEEGFIENRQAIFAQLHQTEPLIPKCGFYQGSAQVPRWARALPEAPIQVHLASGTNQQTTSLPSVSVSLWEQPRGARVITDHAIIRTAPNTGARLTPQREGTLVWVDGMAGAWARLRLSETQGFWIAVADLEWQPARVKTPVSLPLISTYRVSSTVSLVQLPVAEPLPIHIESRAGGLRLHLYGLSSLCDFIQYDPQDAVVQEIQWSQITPEHLQVDIQAPGLSGFGYEYVEGSWILTLKKLPTSPYETVVLLDPGHGGEETGATGPTGLLEKDLNLAVCQRLETLLVAQGFQVFMTRHEDTAVSLAARGQQVEALQVDIVLSLHHNALPDGRDPLQAQGASCYYYHAFSHPLARHLQKSLVEGLNVSDYGIFYDSLAMTRIPQALAVLVEVGFMTFPEEYDRLIDPAFQQQTVEVLAQALWEFCTLPQG